MRFRRRSSADQAQSSDSAGPSEDSVEALSRADALAAAGRPLEGIALLTEVNRARRDPAIERRLVSMRHEGFATMERSGPPAAEAASPPESARAEDGPPEVAAEALTPELLRAAILDRGCLLVRGLVPEPRVEGLVEAVDGAFSGFDAHAAGAPTSETTPWYEPFEPDADGTIAMTKGWVRQGDGVFGAESPRALFELIDSFEQAGLRELMRGYLGEPPAISVKKVTLRRTRPEVGTTWWHQDGAFLGEGIRALNLWLSLSHCGRDAPGLDIVPRRLDRIVETGTEGAPLSWTVSPELVGRESDRIPVSRPLFGPGDALLFDQLFLHRTGADERMTRTRYAVETWFFAPSACPEDQVPLAF